VALRSGVETIDCLSCDVDRGIEPEGALGETDVVVDGFWHAHDGNAFFAQLARAGQCALSADGDDGIELVRFDRRFDPVDAIFEHVRLHSTGAEDCAATRQRATEFSDVKHLELVLHDATPAVLEPEEFVTKLPLPLSNNAADHRVQTWAIAPTGQDSYTHGRQLRS